MQNVIHLLTRPPDETVERLIATQRELPGTEVEVIDLTQADPDYQRLLERIFAADSVASW